jgi:hypothetical protein
MKSHGLSHWEKQIVFPLHPPQAQFVQPKKGLNFTAPRKKKA